MSNLEGRAWTAAEDEYLRGHYGPRALARQTGEAIGRALGRTREAVANRARALGYIGASWRRLDPVTVARLHAQGLTDGSIARQTGFHRHTVEAVRHSLGLAPHRRRRLGRTAVGREAKARMARAATLAGWPRAASLAQVAVLELLKARPLLTASDVREALGCSRSQATQHLRNLLALSLVECYPGPSHAPARWRLA